ncbi:MAG TPA: DUF4350 domain-containing protein [Candidatus Baltobacteraceae bacterium]|jgi:hypothetical protein|nr:DUF4350 domain-containing protein [Candidatus Baltobacteraceae bacterium]
MNSRSRIFEILFALAGMVVLTVLNMSHSEHETQPSTPFSSFDDGPEGYHAWYELLVKEGLDVSRFSQRAAFLDASTATLIVAEAPAEFAVPVLESDVVALADWIREGGTLIVLGNVSAFRRIADELKPSPMRSVSSMTLRTAGINHLDAASKSPSIRRAYAGRGAIIYLADARLLTNSRISRGDRARFAFWLAQTRRRTGNVAFDETPHGYLTAVHWWLLFPRTLVAAIVAGAIIVILAMVGAGIRFGPPIHPVQRRDPSSSEYIEAVASLFARADAAHKALTDALHSVARLIAKRVGLPDDVPIGILADRLARPELRAALLELENVSSIASPDAANLIRGIASARLLRKEILTNELRRG